MHTYFKIAALCLMMLSLVSCSEEDEYLLEIRPDGDNFVIKNTSRATVYYLIIESNMAAVIDLDPNYTNWPSIEASESVTLPYENVSGYTDGSESANVYAQTQTGIWENYHVNF